MARGLPAFPGPWPAVAMLRSGRVIRPRGRLQWDYCFEAASGRAPGSVKGPPDVTT